MKHGRVLLTTDAVGGVWTYALELAAGLTGEGWDVTLAVLGPPPLAAQRQADELRGVDVVVTELPLDWMEDDVDIVEDSGRAIADMARLVNAEVVHLNSPALAASAAFDAPVIGACHSCLASWWRDVRGGVMPAPFQARTQMLARGYARCDALIAPSAAFAEATAALYGVRPFVVRNGRSPGARGAGGAKEPVILTSGRLWDEGKNVAAVDRAAARLSWPVFAAGPTTGPNGCASTFAAIRRLGALPPAKLDAWLNRAAIFVAVSRYEPFGLGVLEAAQAGCALVLSDIPTFRELWGDAALYVAPYDADQLSGALSGLCEDEERRAELGRRGRERAQRYSRAAMVEGTLRAYQRAQDGWRRAVA